MKNKLKNTYIISAFLWLLCTCVSVSAHNISPEEAEQIAFSFIRDKYPMKIQSANKEDYLHHAHTIQKDNRNLIYIFNQNNNNGFIMVSADNRTMSILGYSDSGCFNNANLPKNFSDLLQYYENQILNVIENDWEIVQNTENNYYENYQPIEPLITTKWGQQEPYNALCPIDPTSGERSVTGCVITAIAQILNYHKWPDIGVGELTYSKNNINLFANYGETEYKWDNMLDTYDNNSSQESIDAVAQLMLHCGIAFDAVYHSAETIGALKKKRMQYNFKYDSIKSIAVENPEKEIYNELISSRPVYLGGISNVNGHAFICDGYSGNGYFHINWGWNGESDGYYLLSALSPFERDYDYFITEIHAIIPPFENINGKRIYFDGTLKSNFNEEEHATVTITPEIGGFYSNQRDLIEGTLGLKLIDYDENITYVEGEKITFQSSQPQIMKFSFEKFSKGVYIATPVFKETGEDWEDIRWLDYTFYPKNYQTKLYVKSDGIFLDNFLLTPSISQGKPFAEISAETVLFQNKKLSLDLSAKIKLDSGDFCNDCFHVALYKGNPFSDKKDLIEIKYFDEPIYIVGDEEIEISRDILFTNDLDEGSYYIALCSDRKKVYSNYIPIEVSGIDNTTDNKPQITIIDNELRLMSDESINDIVIYSISGTKTLYLQDIDSSSTDINISHFSAGIYIVKVRTKTIVKTIKFVVK